MKKMVVIFISLIIGAGSILPVNADFEKVDSGNIEKESDLPSQRLRDYEDENGFYSLNSDNRAVSSGYSRAGNFKILTTNNKVLSAKKMSGPNYISNTGEFIRYSNIYDSKEVIDYKKEVISIVKPVMLFTEPFNVSTYQTIVTLPVGKYDAYRQAGEFIYIRSEKGDGWICPQYNSGGTFLTTKQSDLSSRPSALKVSSIGNVPVKQKIIKVREASRPALAMKPEYITIHNTANTGAGANALAHANLQYNGNSRTASWHYTVDNREIWQSMPINEVAWHAGDGFSAGNGNTVAIEICENADGNYKKAEYNAAMLAAQLLFELELGPDAIKMHNYWSGKECPRNMILMTKESMGWNAFCEVVKKQYAKLLTSKYGTGNGVAVTYLQREEDFAIGVNYLNATSNTLYQWTAYNIETGKEEIFAPWQSANWASWKPEKGDYWIVYEAKNPNGVIVRDAFHYKIEKDFAPAEEIALGEFSTVYNPQGVSVALEHEGEAKAYRFKEVNIETKEQKILTEWITSNSVNWYPSPGKYWLSAEVENIKGVVSTFNNYYDIKEDYSPGEKLAIKGITWSETDQGIDIGADFTGGDTTEFRWQSYDLDTQSWQVISDWKKGNWSTWKPSKGNYWLHVEARNQSGKYHSYTISMSVDRDYTSLYQTKIDGLTWKIKDDGIDVGVSYTSSDSEVDIKWQSYNLDTQTWQVISDWKKGNWSTWKPGKGNYWLHVEVKDREGKVTSETINFAVERDYTFIYQTKIDGLTWKTNDGGIDIGVSYASNDSEVDIKWQSYNLDTQTWQVISDWKKGNWSTWKPSKGNYWLHVEIKDREGKLTSETICFAVNRDYNFVHQTKIDGLTWKIKDDGIDIGVSYTSNDSEVDIKWQSYNLDTQTWQVISDWKKGNWSTWKPSKGNYWLYVEIKDREGKVTSEIICFVVGKDYY